MENKEELEITKKRLEELLLTNDDYKSQLADINKRLEDADKPEATPMFLDKIYETILEAVEGIDLTDGINCDFEIDYDNRVTKSDVQFDSCEDITRAIYEEVEKLFAEAECPEDEFGRTESDNHPVDKLQG